MKIAIIGTGISGLVVAHLLHRDHDLTIFESQSHIGGHTLTSDIEFAGETYAVDAGFVVYNERTYPNFVRLLDRLSVGSQPTDMSFSVRDEKTGLEYCGSSLNGLFAQRVNLLRPNFWRMIGDIVRFNRAARREVQSGQSVETLGAFLEKGGYSKAFSDHYLVPMTAAIWSTDSATMLSVPAHFLFRFMDNHGLLGVRGHFPWRVVEGGSRTYVEAITASLRERIRLNTPVTGVRRTPSAVEVRSESASELYDQVVFATHSDQTLQLLDDPSAGEREILSAIPYQANEAILHTDMSLLPRRSRARASWNYLLTEEESERVQVTYDMTRLQRLGSPQRFLLSLNLTDRIAPELILRRFQFDHPLFTSAAVEAQKRHSEISGVNRTHYCGAYWRNGFHEDGVVSALRVGEALGSKM